MWDRIKKLFLKKEKVKLDKEFEESDLIFKGDEPECWACQLPIHETEFRRKLNGKTIHRSCFKKIKKIAMNGGNINDF